MNHGDSMPRIIVLNRLIKVFIKIVIIDLGRTESTEIIDTKI